MDKARKITLSKISRRLDSLDKSLNQTKEQRLAILIFEINKKLPINQKLRCHYGEIKDGHKTISVYTSDENWDAFFYILGSGVKKEITDEDHEDLYYGLRHWAQMNT